jgi:hypothetical protein
MNKTQFEKDLEIKEAYDALLNEIYPEVKIGYDTFDASEILFNCDPIMYNEGLLDFENGLLEMENEELENE